MGSFGGHTLPGSFFIIFALWWVISIYHRYFQCIKRNTRFKSTATYPLFFCPGRLKELPIEPLVKLLFVTVGFSLEIYTGFGDGKFDTLGNGQHATMFFFFGLTGVIDLLLYFKAPLPKDIDYVILSMAVFIEGLLFKFHLHGRNQLDVLIHTLLIYTIVINFFGVILDMKYKNNILCALSRCYGFLLQGTWFWQVAFILYNPNPNAVPWKPDDHDQLMMATMFYAWHCGADFLIILLIGGIIACLHKRFGNGYGDDAIAMKRLIHTGANGQTLISMNDESDSDIEFQKSVSK